MLLPGSRLRAVALLVAGAEALHQARYHLFGPAEAGGAMLDGHAYLETVTPLVLALLGLAALEFLLLLARVPARAPEVRHGPGLPGLWAWATATLLAIYCSQETIEAVAGHGHAGLGRALGAGWWVVLALAVSIGGLVALLLRGSAAALERVATRRRRPRTADATRQPRVQPSRSVEAALNEVARHLAGRGPPISV